MFILTADTALKFADCPKFTKVSSTLAYCRNVSRTLAQDYDDEVVLCTAVLLLRVSGDSASMHLWMILVGWTRYPY